MQTESDATRVVPGIWLHQMWHAACCWGVARRCWACCKLTGRPPPHARLLLGSNCAPTPCPCTHERSGRMEVIKRIRVAAWLANRYPGRCPVWNACTDLALAAASRLHGCTLGCNLQASCIMLFRQLCHAIATNSLPTYVCARCSWCPANARSRTSVGVCTRSVCSSGALYP
jgi:hypothetical protein